jgi:hypothetical protein
MEQPERQEVTTSQKAILGISGVIFFGYVIVYWFCSPPHYASVTAATGALFFTTWFGMRKKSN